MSAEAIIKRGDLVWALDAMGRQLPRRAITGSDEFMVRDFPVIWVCKEEHWDEAQRHSYPPERGDVDATGMPWPIEDVTARVAGVAEEKP